MIDLHCQILGVNKKALKQEYKKVKRIYKIIKFTNKGFIIKFKNVYNEKDNIDYGTFYIKVDFSRPNMRWYTCGGNYKTSGGALHPHIYRYQYKDSLPCLCVGSNNINDYYQMLKNCNILSVMENIYSLLKFADINRARGPDIIAMYFNKCKYCDIFIQKDQKLCKECEKISECKDSN